jgi:signal transduction histidine kinase
MSRFQDATIRTKLTWISAAVTSIALLLAGSAFVGYYVISFRSALVRNLSVQAETIALNSVSALRFDDPQSAEETLSALRADRNIVTAAVYAASGNLFASYAGSADSPPLAPIIDRDATDSVRFLRRSLELDHPIVSEGEHLGTVHLAYSLDDLYADVMRFVVIAFVVLALAVVIALLASARIQRSFSEPVARLAAAARAVSHEKNYAIRVKPSPNRDELAMLIDTFNDMLEQIQVRDTEVEAGKERFRTLNEELEHRVTQRTAELQATNKELEAFTYSVSHDLRAPLRRIDGFAKLLVDDYAANLPDEARHYLSRVREGTKQMGLLVDDLLNLARLGRQEVKLQVAGLSSIVERVATGLKRETEGRDIEWKIEPLPFVECDPALMEVVFTNLLSNAVKYTRPRPHAVIQVGAIQENGHPVIFVRDNGVGFSMKYADKLFGVFQRLHRAEDFEGTGVGLATVQRILHKHAGAIWAAAELDKGACFYFTLGVTPADDSMRERISDAEPKH